MGKTIEKPRKTLGQLFVPICLETLCFMLTGMIDTLMLSSVSDQAVGAVGTANTYISIFIIMFSVISSGMIAVMTQNIGAGKNGVAYQARQIGFRDNIFPYACDASKVFPTSFLKFTTDEQDVITTRYTDIHKHVTEMRDKFITGIVDIETGWDEYCKAIETMGIDEVLEVYQAAYDRWNQ